MKNLFRVISFIKNYYKNPRFLLAYCLHFLSPDFRQEFKFLTSEEFKENILLGKSFIRIGDGETGIINGTGPLFYQKYEKKLAEILEEIIVKYNPSSPYVLGVPQEFINKSNSELKLRDRFYCYYQVKITASLLFPKKMSYGDTIMFYHGDKFLDTFLGYIGNKKVIFVSNQDTISKWANLRTPFSSISYIEGPKNDAFTAYEKLIGRIEHEIRQNSAKDKPVLLLSLGPTSKALAYYFSQRGVTCYDLGVGAEVFFQQKDFENRI